MTDNIPKLLQDAINENTYDIDVITKNLKLPWLKLDLKFDQPTDKDINELIATDDWRNKWNFTGLEKLFPSDKFILVNTNINKAPAYDLYLMTLCKHFILSPSTLHYWAAYLSTNTNKICIAPKYIENKSGYYGFSNNKDIKSDFWLEI